MTLSRGERTLPALFEESVSKFPDHTFLLEKIDGRYRPLTYRQTREYILRCAAGLVSMGIRRGDRIALVAEGRTQWVIAELGILYAGAVNVPLSIKIEERSELKFRLEHAGCRMAVISAGQAPKIREIRGALSELERLILLDPVGEDPCGGSDVTFASVLEAGEQWLASHSSDMDAVWRSVRECDPANICYTSGTVADPKGIILTHRNYTANIEQSVALYPLPDWFCTLLILPWDHSFAHTDGIYALAMCGGSIACVQAGKTAIETLRNIPGNIREVRPTFLLSVPALAKSFRKTVESGVRAKGWGARLLFAAGLAVAFAYNADGWSRGIGWRKLLRPLCGLFDVLLFRRIREGFGGRMEYFIGGGALLDIELQKFFCAIGIPMYQGYGLTEAAPVISANTPRRHKFGSSGMIAPWLDLRICDALGRDLPPGKKGEIVVRGENVMAGYWRNPNATSAALRDGWLYTGDIGYVDRDGFLFVLGREKSLLIGHDGEKYSPEGIEEYIVGHSPYIDQIMLYNNQSPSTVALLVPNKDAIVTWLARHHRLRPEEPAGTEAALRMLEREVAKFRGGGEHGGRFPERWLPSAIGILDEPFTEQNRFLNSTMKMVRGKIASAYSERLAGLFTPEGKDILNERNRRAIAALCAPPASGSSSKLSYQHSANPAGTMKTIFLAFSLLLSVACQAQVQEGNASVPLPSQAQFRWHHYERIMFVHFSANTWQTHRGLDNEYDDLSTPLDRINPSKLNTDQWCEVAESWGARMILFVAKHAGGFCSWRTKTTEYGIKNTPWKNGQGDILEDLSRSCKKYGLDLGIYIYPGDPHWGAGGGGITADSSKQEAYTNIYRQQLTEVLSRYGEIREVWFDGSCRINVDDILKKYAPNAVIFQGPMASLRWVGNEDGYAPFSNWYTLSSKDLRTGVATAIQSDPFGDAYAPVEIDVPLLRNKGHKWFWAPSSDHLIMTTEQLMDVYYKSVGRGAVLLLNSTPDTTGLIPASHAAAYKAFGDEIRRRFDHPLRSTRGEGDLLELAFSEPTEINHVILQEDLTRGQRVLAFSIEGMDEVGKWKEVYSGTSVGFKRICYFQPLRVMNVRVTFTNVRAKPRVANFAVYDIKGVTLEPEKREDRDKFYDGVGSKQGTLSAQEPPVEIGKWEVGPKSAGWKELSLDLTRQVTRVGQYEVAFAAQPSDRHAELEFRDWELEMYGGKAKGAIELLKGKATFRITRSQQTLDEFPTVVRLKMKSTDGDQAGIITVRMLTY